MIILGIDPGIANTGYGIVESNGSHVKHLQLGHIRTDAKTPSEMRLKHIYDTLIELIHCLLYTSPSPRDGLLSRMPSSA